MKEIKEYKAEIFRRSEERNIKKKISRRRTATLCVVLALCISLGTFAALNFTGAKEGIPVPTVVLSNGENPAVITVPSGSAAPAETEIDKSAFIPNAGIPGKTDVELTQIPAFDGKSADLMQGIASRRTSKGEDRTSVAAKLTDFALRLFKQTSEKGKSTLVSPLSVMLALSMTANGAKGETRAQMEKVLGTDIDTLNEVLAVYRESLPQGSKYRLDIANAIWFREDAGFKVNRDFLQNNADWYNAGVYAAPFNNETLEEINAWVKINTRGMIEKILEEISDDSVMYLVNALSFQAEWATAYGAGDVSHHEFTLEDGTKKTAEFMFSKESVYLKDDNAEGFIKYYANKAYAFAALLPDEGVSLSDYIDSLTGDKLYDILSSAQSEKVLTAIPKFRSGSSVNLNEALEAMGMPLAFDKENADFSGIGTHGDGTLYIGNVLHKTFIEVAEKGTKAGAATVVDMNYYGLAPGLEQPKKVYLDRPFVYMLIDCETNTPFFIGTLTDVDGTAE